MEIKEMLTNEKSSDKSVKRLRKLMKKGYPIGKLRIKSRADLHDC